MGIGRRDPAECLVPLLDASGVRAAVSALFDDGLAVEAFLEAAAERVWTSLADRFAPGGSALVAGKRAPRWLVLAGPGHNGADGWALARKAAEAGCEVDVYEPLGDDERGGSSGARTLSRAQERFARSQGVNVMERGSFTGAFLEARNYILRVDAIFGFGLSRDLEPSLVAFLRQRAADERARPTWRIALDLPTGLCSDTGRPRPFALPSQETFVLGAMKPGLLSETAPEATGQLRYVPLGLRSGGGASPGDRAFLSSPLDPSSVCGREPTEHKLSQGELLLVVGSARYPGAGILTVAAAHAARPGYVRLMSDSNETRSASLVLRPETIVSELSSTIASATRGNTDAFVRVRAAVVGCGMERPESDARDALFDALLRGTTLVVDGAWCTRESVESAHARGLDVILTPHAGEFARAFPDLARAWKDSRLAKAETARIAAREWGCHVVLKGPYTAIASPDGNVWQSTLVNPHLARAGSGDLLAGFLGGLLVSGLAKGWPLLPLLATGVWWHGSFRLTHEESANLRTRESGEWGSSEGLALARYLAHACAP